MQYEYIDKKALQFAGLFLLYTFPFYSAIARNSDNYRDNLAISSYAQRYEWRGDCRAIARNDRFFPPLLELSPTTFRPGENAYANAWWLVGDNTNKG